jgi:hypothetical protein
MYGGGSCTLRALDGSGGLIREVTIPGLAAEDLAEMSYTTEIRPSSLLPSACFLRWEDDYMLILGQIELWEAQQVPDCQVPDHCMHMSFDVKYRSPDSSDTETNHPEVFDQVDVNMAETYYIAWAESSPSLSSASPYDPEQVTEGWAHFAGPALALGEVEGPGGEQVTREPEEMAAMLPLIEETWPGLDHFELSWSFDPEAKWTSAADSGGE